MRMVSDIVLGLPLVLYFGVLRIPCVYEQLTFEHCCHNILPINERYEIIYTLGSALVEGLQRIDLPTSRFPPLPFTPIPLPRFPNPIIMVLPHTHVPHITA